MTQQSMGMDVFEQLDIDSGKKKKFKELEKKRMQLEADDERVITDYEKGIEDMLEGRQQVDVEQLSKLNEGIERGKEFKGEITDLAYSLTLELSELGQFFGDASQYQGLERWISKISTRWADTRRMARVQQADVKQNLQSILDYGNFMVKRLYDLTLENMEKGARIEATLKTTAKKLKENQPLYDEWRAKRETLERQVGELKDKMDRSAGAEYAQLAGQKVELDAEFTEAQKRENYYFTIVDAAKQAKPIQETHLKAYRDMVDSLMQFKTRLEENINHVTEVYSAAPTAIRTALSMKAASQYDKGMKYATDKATDTVLKSVRGVLDETASRAERPLIEPEKLAAYRRSQLEMRAEFDNRTNAIKTKYDAPEATSTLSSAPYN